MESTTTEQLTRVALPTYRPGAVCERGLLEISADGVRHRTIARTASPLWIVTGIGIAFLVVFAIGYAYIASSGGYFHFGLFLLPLGWLGSHLVSRSVKEFHVVADGLTASLRNTTGPVSATEGKSGWHLSWPDVREVRVGDSTLSLTDGIGKKRIFFLYGTRNDSDGLMGTIQSFSSTKISRITPAPRLAAWAMFAGLFSLCPFAGFVLSPIAIVLARKARERPAENYWRARLGYVLALVGIAVAIGFVACFAYDQWSYHQTVNEMENW